MSKEYVIETPRKVIFQNGTKLGVITIPRKIAEEIKGKWVVVKLKVLDTEFND